MSRNQGKGFLPKKYVSPSTPEPRTFVTSPHQHNPPEESEPISLGNQLFLLYRPVQRRVWEVVALYDYTQTDAIALDERLEGLGLEHEGNCILQKAGFNLMDGNAEGDHYSARKGRNPRTNTLLRTEFSEDTAHLILAREDIELHKPLNEWYGADKSSITNEVRRIISQKQQLI